MENKNRLSKARAAANKRWDEKNRARKQYLNRRSTARSFIQKDATPEDLTELENLIFNRMYQNIADQDNLES